FESGKWEDKKNQMSEIRDRGMKRRQRKRNSSAAAAFRFLLSYGIGTLVTCDGGYAFPSANRNGVPVVSAWGIPEPDCFGARSRFRGHAAAPSRRSTARE